MVFITLKLTVSKNKLIFLRYCFYSFLYNCYQTFLWTGRIYFLVIYKLFLFSVRFVWRYVDFVNKFSF